MKKLWWLLTVLFVFGSGSSMQEKDALIIYGKGFVFSVLEPKKWTCHTEDAYRYRMNAYFCLGKNNINDSPAIMHITVFGKAEDTILESLAYDIENYKKHYKQIELKDFPIEGLRYEYASKTFVIEDKTVDYVCFLDPDKKSKLYLVFVLHGPKEVSPDYEKDFITLIKSFTWLGQGR